MKQAYSVLLLLTVFLTGCVRETLDINNLRTICSVAADLPDMAETKAHLSERKVTWDANDVIGVFSDVQGVAYYRNENAADGTAGNRFSGQSVSGTEFYAFYPGDGSIGFNPDDRKILSFTYEPTSSMIGTNPPMNLPMVATMSSDVFSFKQTMGLIHFSIQGEHTIKYLRLRGNNSEALAGHGTIDLSESAPVFVLDDTAAETELLCQPDEPYSIPADGMLHIYFPLPGLLFKDGLSLEICYLDGGEERVVTKYTDRYVSVVRRMITSFAVVDLDKLIEESAPIEYVEPNPVDMGILITTEDGGTYKVLFGDFNLGATKPEEFGCYYAWGETEPKRKYDWKIYKWCDGAESTLTKYNTDSSQGKDGFTDDKTELEPEDDAARVNLGGAWRMPTRAEMEALFATKGSDDYSWEWKTVGDSQGWEIVHLATDNKLFLPVAGYWLKSYYASDGDYGRYWTSTLNDSDAVKGYSATITSSYASVHSIERAYGLPIRPVCAGVAVTGVTLDRTTADITTGEVLTLTATVHPEDAGNLNVVWSSSDEAVATVSQDGKVTGVALGRVTITVTTVDRGLTATCKVSVRNAAPEPYVTPDPVDIGLSVKWGSFNLGAKEIAGYGYYFAWGETWTKDTYSSDNYWWREDGSIFRYFQLDERTRLVPQDDAVHVNLGGKWRMPTYDEFEELYGTCRNHRDYEWEWKVVNGHAGYEIRYLVNGNSIFLPAAGLREVDTLAGVDTVVALLSADLDPTSYGSSALAMTLEENELYGSVPALRSGGYTIRPVYDEDYVVVDTKGISLERTTLEIYEGQTYDLVATVSPDNATNKYVNWSTSDKNIATVDYFGKIVAQYTTGKCTITAVADNGGATATCTVIVKEDPFAGNVAPLFYSTPDAVDMGLSVKWGSFNLGATKREEYGCYYAWGETDPKSYYHMSTYRWNHSDGGMTKYCLSSENGFGGFTDGKSVLDPEDDAAHVKLGGKWRMPTEAEMDELIATNENPGYRWTWKTLNGHNGWEIVCLANGNSLFFPAVGFFWISLHPLGDGYYWTSTLDASGSDNARHMGFYSKEVYAGMWTGRITRDHGLCIRPVYAE